MFLKKYWGDCWYHQGACCHMLSREFHHIGWKPNSVFLPSLAKENNESAKSSCMFPLEAKNHKLWNLQSFIFCFVTKQKMKLMLTVCRITCHLSKTNGRKKVFIYLLCNIFIDIFGYFLGKWVERKFIGFFYFIFVLLLWVKYLFYSKIVLFLYFKIMYCIVT